MNSDNKKNTINITGLDKVSLLKNMWDNMPIASFFMQMPHLSPEFDYKSAENAVKNYIDYFSGRCIKTNLSSDFVDPSMYDRDAGTGALAKIVKSMRK